MADGEKDILAEFQIRTLAMNFWATAEHSLNYKYKQHIPNEIKDKLIKSELYDKAKVIFSGAVG